MLQFKTLAVGVGPTNHELANGDRFVLKSKKMQMVVSTVWKYSMGSRRLGSDLDSNHRQFIETLVIFPNS